MREGLGTRLQWYVPMCDATHTHTHTFLQWVNKVSSYSSLMSLPTWTSLFLKGAMVTLPRTPTSTLCSKRDLKPACSSGMRCCKEVCTYGIHSLSLSLSLTLSLSLLPPPPSLFLSFTHSLSLCVSISLSTSVVRDCSLEYRNCVVHKWSHTSIMFQFWPHTCDYHINHEKITKISTPWNYLQHRCF